MFNQFPNIPNLNFNFQQQQPRNTITFVRGYEGACNYFIPPNSTVLLMDEAQAQFYIKSIDINGNTSIKIYRFEEVVPKKEEYVSVEEFIKINITPIQLTNFTPPKSTQRRKHYRNFVISILK